MFGDALHGDLYFDSPVADQIFPNIRADAFREDTTFRVNMRVLLHNRLPEGSEISMVYVGSGYSVTDLESMGTPKGFLDRVMSETDADLIELHNLTSYASDAREKALEYFDKLPEVNPDYKEAAALRNWFSDKHMTARVYINKAKRKTLLVMCNMNLQAFHLVSSIMPTYLPWYFSEKPQTMEEVMLLVACGSGENPEDYRQRLAEFAQRFDFRSKAIDILLGGFEKRSWETRIQTINAQVDQRYGQAERLMEEYSVLMHRIEELNIELMGMRCAAENAGGQDTELMQFFKANPNLHVVSADGNELNIIVRGYISIYDPEMHAALIKNSQSHYFRTYSVGIPALVPSENRKKFLDAVFGPDATLKIRTCAFYNLCLDGHGYTQAHYEYPREFNDCIPNPHIHRHSCLGDHQRFINQCLQNGDLVGAVVQCQSSVASVNLMEEVTVRPFLEALFKSNGSKIIELPSGANVTVEQAWEWLQAQEAHAKEEQHG